MKVTEFIKWLWDGKPFSKTIELHSSTLEQISSAITEHAKANAWTDEDIRAIYDEVLKPIGYVFIYRTDIATRRSKIKINVIQKAGIFTVEMKSSPGGIGTAHGDPHLHQRNVERLENYLTLLLK